DPHRHGDRVQGRFPVLAAHAAQRQSDGVAHVAHVAEAVHDLEGAHELWDLAVRTAHDTGAVADEAHALAGRGSLRLATGQVEGAVADLQLSLRIAVDSEQLLMAGYAEALLARAHAWRGEHPQALAACARSAGLTGPRPFAITVASRRWAAGLVALAEQRPEDAWTQLQGVGVHPPTAALALGDLVEAAVRTGRPEVLAAARAAAAAAEREAQSLQAHHLQALVHRARALLHAHDGDADGAQAAFEAAGRAGADGSCPLELARTRLLHGEWLRRQRRIVDARELLAAALTGFEAAGARSLARRAGAELRAAGVVPAVAVGDGGEDPAALLTAQELQIARLAASGLTNKEIADKVYLSHRTIAAHLYKAFPKLGITHRTQLRDAIAGPRAHPAGVDEPTPAAAPPESAPVPEPVPVPVGAVGARPAAGPSPDVPPAPAPVALSARFADVAVVAASADEVAAAAARQLVTDFDPTLVSVVLRGPRPGVLRHWSVRGGGLDVDAHGWRTASLPHESPSLAPARRGRGDFHETLATFETRCPLVQGVVRSAGLRALVDLPLTASGRVVGFLVLGWDTEQDLPPAVRRTLEEFAATCAQALERVLAAARGSSLLRSLQAVVPERLVSTPHVQLAGRRLAAGLAGGPGPHAGEEVGGDWYDAFAGEGGSTVLIVGDVTGHGPAVAATAASLRAVLASHVLDRPSPAHALTRLDCAVERLALPAGATAVVLEATPAPSGCYRLRWSNAGHPPPLVLLPDGAVEPLRSVPELPVGVDAQAVRRDHEREVPAGSTLVLVTDGVLETRTQDVVTGLEKLGADLARGRGLAPQALVDRLLAGVAAEVEDDVTVLAARLGPPAAASAPAHGLPVLPVMPVLPVQAGALAAAVPRPGALA
ncbi:SpoIIE family protein phosphatase, partial [Kineococcus aurantiacus]|uniref:SpoIIE family protein phosphatase n=1 Tax=Kineococcus aurantiacus TaxID=37633 RepID=UPI0031D4C32C